MTHLGEFGEEPDAAADATFGYFGETFHADPSFGQLDYVDFLVEVGADPDQDGVTATLVKRMARLCIADSDFDAFWALAKQNRQTEGQVFKVLRAIVEATIDRPTSQPSDSSDGQPTTGGKSADAAYSRALDSLEGRPDLQVVVAKAHEAKAG